MSFLSKDLSVPDAADGGSFRLRPIAIHDAFRDDDAVTSSREHPWSRFGEGWGRPSAALSLEPCVLETAGMGRTEAKCGSSEKTAHATTISATSPWKSIKGFPWRSSSR